MDLSDPTRAITPTLDGTVLAVLATAGKPLSVGQVAQLAARGSEIGIRRSLGRLVEQGTVRAIVMGRNTVHELNRDHVAARVAEALADLRVELWKRFRTELDSWRIPALQAWVFGSAARGDGQVESDIDLLLVHAPLPDEQAPRGTSLAVSRVAEVVQRVLLDGQDAAELWQEQLAGLHDKVESWTGNSLQIVDLSFREWLHPPKQYQQLLTDVRHEGIELRGESGLARSWTTKSAGG